MAAQATSACSMWGIQTHRQNDQAVIRILQGTAVYQASVKSRLWFMLLMFLSAYGALLTLL